MRHIVGAAAVAGAASAAREPVGITKVRELLETFQETAISEGKEAAALQEEKSCTCTMILRTYLRAKIEEEKKRSEMEKLSSSIVF